MALNKDFKVKNGLTVTESLSVGGDSHVNALTATTFEALTATFGKTIVSTTSALSVINNGTGPALTVQQDGSHPIAHFIDKNGKDIIFHDDGKVSIGSRTAVEQLTVTGNISATGGINTAGGLSAMNVLSANNYFAGNVGIGTTSPAQKLHVAGTIRTHTNATTKYIDLFGGNSGNFIDTYGNSLYIRYGGDTSKGIILNSSGNVGIGTTAPAEKLTVAGNISANGGITASCSSCNSTFAGNVGIGTATPAPTSGSRKTLHVKDTTNGVELRAEGNGSIVNIKALSEGFIGTQSADKFHLQTNNANQVTIDSTGKVGIGTTSPQEKLTVTGNLTATGSICTAATTNGFMSAGRDLADIFGCSSGDITGVTAGTGLNGGGSTGSVTLNVDAAQTGISCITNTSLDVGRDADNLVKFGTDNEITFRVGGGDGVTFKSSGEIEATSLDIEGDVDINGKLETDELSIAGTDVDATAAELNQIHSITDGTVAANKAVIVDTNKDITGFRNITLTGELDAASLDIEGDADINGTLETDALSINDVTVTSTATELNTLSSTTFDVQSQLQALSSNKLAKTGCAADSALLNGNNSSYFQTAITTSARVGANCIGGGTVSNAEFNQLSGVTFDIQSQLQALSSNSPGDITSVTAGTGLNGGGTGGDVTLNIDAAQTGITSIKNTSLNIGRDNDNLIKFGNDNCIKFHVAGEENVLFKADGEIEACSLDISGNVDIDGILETDALTIDSAPVCSTATQLNTLSSTTS